MSKSVKTGLVACNLPIDTIDSALAHGKSGLKPVAQNIKPCWNREKEITELERIYRGFLMNSGKYSMLAALIELMYEGGLRVSEALNVRSEDITSRGSVRIKGLKGSRDRIVEPVKYRSFWLRCRESGDAPGFYYSRFSVYREMRKIGLYMQFSGSSVVSVTHVFRHLKALDLKEVDSELKLTSGVLGHKNESNTEFYVRKPAKWNSD